MTLLTLEPSSRPADPERLLLKQVASGDPGAWNALVRRHLEAAHAFAWSILQDASLAEDAAQEAFLRLRARAASFEGNSSVRTWILGITRRVCLELNKARRRPPPVSFRSCPAGPVDRLILEERLGLARERFCRLSEEDRALLILSADQGLSAAQMALILGCSEGACRVRLHRARARWRHLTEDLGGPDGA